MGCPFVGTTDGVLLLSLETETVLLTFDCSLLHIAFCLDVVAAVEEIGTGVGLSLFFLFTLFD